MLRTIPQVISRSARRGVRHASATPASYARQQPPRHYGAEVNTCMQLVRSHAAAALARGPDDVLTADMEFERGAPFCANPACALHVRLIDSQVEGGGNWVTLPDGRMFGRSLFGKRLLCDACGTRRGPVRLGSAAITG